MHDEPGGGGCGVHLGVGAARGRHDGRAPRL